MFPFASKAMSRESAWGAVPLAPFATRLPLLSKTLTSGVNWFPDAFDASPRTMLAVKGAFSMRSPPM